VATLVAAMEVWCECQSPCVRADVTQVRCKFRRNPFLRQVVFERMGVGCWLCEAVVTMKCDSAHSVVAPTLSDGGMAMC
jgi:hypothetical protein